jgi:hypothetical protein
MKKMKASGNFYQLVKIEKGVAIDKHTISQNDIETLSFNTNAKKLLEKDLVIISGASAKALKEKL